MSIAIKYHSARRCDGQKSNALILCDLSVMLTPHELDVIEPDSEHGKQQHHENLYDPESATEVLRGVFKFHDLNT
jgi:hypothetical protein